MLGEVEYPIPSTNISISMPKKNSVMWSDNALLFVYASLITTQLLTTLLNVKSELFRLQNRVLGPIEFPHTGFSAQGSG